MNKHVYCYSDPWRWGQSLKAAVLEKSGSAAMFSHAVQVPDEASSIAFVHFTAGDSNSLRLRDELAAKQHARTIPSLDEARLFNDRVAQFKSFGTWLPYTRFTDTYAEALRWINEVDYPIVSKSRESAGYRGVRLIADNMEGFREVDSVFGDGIEGPGHARQSGYLLWQSYIRNPGFTWRVLMFCKRYGIVFKRYWRFGDDGIDCRAEPLETLTPELEQVLSLARIFCVDNGFNWCATDVICGTDRQKKATSPFVTSMTTTWPPWWLDRGGMIFQTIDGLSWESSGLPAVSIWRVIAEAILEGQFYG